MLLLSVLSCVTAVAHTQKKDHGHSAKSARGSYTWTYAHPSSSKTEVGCPVLFRHSVGTHQGKELTRNSSGNARQGKLVRSHLSSMSHCRLTLASRVVLLRANYLNQKQQQQKPNKVCHLVRQNTPPIVCLVIQQVKVLLSIYAHFVVFGLIISNS